MSRRLSMASRLSLALSNWLACTGPERWYTFFLAHSSPSRMTVEASATNDAPPAEVAEEKAKIVEQVVDARELELQAVIGFKGAVIDGMQLHPDNKHLLYPLGCKFS